MNIRLPLIILSLFIFLVFTLFSYSVAKEHWQKKDFDTTVRLQDHISRRFDPYFSFLSILGSAEVTITLAAILAIFSFLKRKWLATLAWLLILPATLFEVYGKLVVFHPGPPEFLRRTVLEAKLPSFYIQTNFSYPSGHMTRVIFLIVVLSVLIIFSKVNWYLKTALISGLCVFGLLMSVTRIYLGEHWLSDVIGGSLLGLAAGLLAASLVIAKRVRVS